MYTKTTSRPPLPARSLLQGATFERGSVAALLLFVYVALAPNVHPLSELSLYDGKRVLQVSLLLANAIWLIWSFRNTDGPAATFAAIPLTGRRLLTTALILGCLSAAFAPLPAYGFLEVFHLALIAGLCLTVAYLFRSNALISSTVIIAVIVLGVALYILAFAVGYGMSLVYPHILTWPGGYFGFENIRFFNQYQTWTLPFLVVLPLMLPSGGRWIRAALLAPAALWWSLAFASGGRGVIVASVLSTIVVLVTLRRSGLDWAKFQAAAAAAGTVLYVVLFKVITTIDSSILERNISSGGRLLYWERALDEIQGNWMLGIGPMHHAGAATEYWSHPHNVFIQTAMEWGLPAAILLFTALTWAFVAWIRQSRSALDSGITQRDTPIRVALTAALSAGAAHALVSGVTVMPMSQVLMALVIGWALGMYIRDKSDFSSRENTLQRGRLVALATMIAIAVVVVSTVVLPDVLRREQSEDVYIEEVRPKNFHPRFWRQGAIRY